MGTIVSNSHTLNRVGLFSDFIFVNVNDMNIYFFRIYIYSRIFVCTLLLLTRYTRYFMYPLGVRYSITQKKSTLIVNYFKKYKEIFLCVQIC